jgi:hypothetical protein
MLHYATWRYPTLLYAIRRYSSLPDSSLPDAYRLYPTLFDATWRSSMLPDAFSGHCWLSKIIKGLPDATRRYSTLYYSTLLVATRLRATRRYPTLFDATRRFWGIVGFNKKLKGPTFSIFGKLTQKATFSHGDLNWFDMQRLHCYYYW